MKRCAGCGRTLPLECFTIRRASRDGLQAQCRTCSNTAQRVNRAHRRLLLMELTGTLSDNYQPGRYVVATTSGFPGPTARGLEYEATVLDTIRAHQVVASFVSRDERRTLRLARALAFTMNRDAR